MDKTLGLVESKIRKRTGHTVDVYDLDFAILPFAVVKKRGRYLTLCTAHQTSAQFKTKSDARGGATKPDTWCDQCLDLVFPKNGERESTRNHLFVFNVCCYAVLVTLFFCWLWWYTEDFAHWIVKTGPLLLAVLPFLRGFSPLRATIDKIFKQPTTTIVLITAFLCLAAAFFGNAMLVVKMDGEDRAFLLTDTAGSDMPMRKMHLKKDKETKIRIKTDMIGRRNITLFLEGLPSLNVSLYPGTRRSLTVPLDFQRRVLLVTPPTFMTLMWFDEGAPSEKRHLLTVLADDKTLVKNIPFEGSSFFIGCDTNVAIPREIERQWQIRLSGPIDLGNEVLQRWKDPICIAPNLALEEVEKVRILIYNTNKFKIVDQIIDAEKLSIKNKNDFVQNVLIKTIKKEK